MAKRGYSVWRAMNEMLDHQEQPESKAWDRLCGDLYAWAEATWAGNAERALQAEQGAIAEVRNALDGALPWVGGEHYCYVQTYVDHKVKLLTGQDFKFADVSCSAEELVELVRCCLLNKRVHLGEVVAELRGRQAGGGAA